MGRVALLSTWATEQAIADAGLEAEYVRSDKVGLAYGSTGPSSGAVEDYVRKLMVNRTVDGIQSATYPKLMSHTCAANLAVYFGIRGRVITTCAACVSSSQAIGYGYEAVRHGRAGGDDLRRRRGAGRRPRDGVRRHVRHLDALQRTAGRDAAAVRRATATASWWARAPGRSILENYERARAARRANLRGGHRLRDQLRRLPHDGAHRRRHGPGAARSASRAPGSPRPRSTT